jgi:hypothetical protein
MSAGSAKFGVSQVGVRAFREPAVAERTKRQLIAEVSCAYDLFNRGADVVEFTALGDPGEWNCAAAMLVVAPEHVSGNRTSFDIVQFSHQFRKERSPRRVEQRPPSLFPRLRMNDMDAVGPLRRAVVLDFESAKEMFLTLQPFPRGEGCGSD